ncbi:hypothetical protein K737_300907 [Holospora undulata HU1]|uniref:Uncharacterized protein n=1 Tax=Holospora undulata HU1 TaxID=1321371 RepID=A0A061JHB6_9PROT|nr:hypothetical protein K737_300907 [Holospora undulata HU1]
MDNLTYFHNKKSNQIHKKNHKKFFKYTFIKNILFYFTIK